MQNRKPISLEDVEKAAELVKSHIHRTPLLRLSTAIVDMIREVAAAAHPSQESPALDIRLKCENFQRVGAFKFRGATNAVSGTLSTNPDVKIVATHSSGNHGAALALAAKLSGIQSLIIVPDTAPPNKVEAIRGYNGNVVFSKPAEREETLARVVAEKQTLLGQQAVEVIPPFNHPLVMAGQGTLALEVLEVRVVSSFDTNVEISPF
ncbi:serine racemase-like [Condylostylus longicornis]|uniref:serine racemase-like n=1 Tax=Condylostylus longicornis TaxID=2530218 RepID=UPI00244E0FD7|nr:serine racemase-like [Condylostylus longicornis]